MILLLCLHDAITFLDHYMVPSGTLRVCALVGLFLRASARFISWLIDRSIDLFSFCACSEGPQVNRSHEHHVDWLMKASWTVTQHSLILHWWGNKLLRTCWNGDFADGAQLCSHHRALSQITKKGHCCLISTCDQSQFSRTTQVISRMFSRRKPISGGCMSVLMPPLIGVWIQAEVAARRRQTVFVYEDQVFSAADNVNQRGSISNQSPADEDPQVDAMIISFNTEMVETNHISMHLFCPNDKA